MYSLINTLLEDTNKGVILFEQGNITLISSRAEEYLNLSPSVKYTSIEDLPFSQLFIDLLDKKVSKKSLFKCKTHHDYSITLYSDTQVSVTCSETNTELTFSMELVQEDTKAIIVQKETKPDYQDIIEINSDLIGYIYDPSNVELKYISNFQIQTKDFLNLIHHGDVSKVKDIIEQIYLGSEIQQETVTCRVKIQDRWRVYELVIQSQDLFPNLTHSVITGKDITNIYIANQRRKVINRVLRHDLRNEINVINGYADILSDETELKLDEIQQYADNIYKKSTKLLRLSNEIKEIDQELYRVDRKLRKLDINTIIEEQVQTIQNEYPNVEFRISLDSNSKIIGNTLLNSAIQHILENGIIHNPKENKYISIQSSHDPIEKELTVTITDNGPGIDMSVKKIIESGIEKPLEHTTGLGLWIVKWIIEIIDGQIQITQKSKDEGTKIILTFHDETVPIEKINNKNRKLLQDIQTPEFGTDKQEIKTTTRTQ